MAVGYYIDVIDVDHAHVSLISLLRGWCESPDNFCDDNDEEDDDDPDAVGCRKYSNNRETFGCLFTKFEVCKNPMHNYRVIRAGV